MPVLCPPRPSRPPGATRPRRLRSRAAVLLLGAATVGAGAFGGCGADSERRDRHYGTDAGADYRLPDASPDRATDGGDTGAGADASGVDQGAADAGEPADAGPDTMVQDTGEAADSGSGG